MTASLPQRARLGATAFVLGAVLAIGAPRALSADDVGGDAEMRELAQAVATSEDARYAWNDAVRLMDLGDKAVATVLDALKTDGVTPIGRIALARVLIGLAEYGRATEVLLGVSRSDAPVDVRVDAVRLLADGDRDDATIESLWKLLDTSLDARLRSAVAKCIYELDPDVRALDKLKELLGSEDFTLRVEGALALAELRNFADARVKTTLQHIRGEPTDRGRLANALLRQHEFELSQAERAAAPPPRTPAATKQPLVDISGDGPRLVEEAIQDLKDRFVDPKAIDEKKLWEGAARGMVDALGDPHTTYQSVSDRADWSDHLTKEYGGIGAYVGFDDQGFFIVTRPMFGSPAWEAELKSGDRVLEVDGWPTQGEDINDIVDRLRGPAGKDVEISIYRKGWEVPRKRSLKRGRIQVPTVYAELLPGKVGYILIDTFAQNTAEEFRVELTKLEREGATSLVLDLRFNGGGYLSAAVQIADTLLPKGRLVVETKGRGPKGDPWFSQGSSSAWGRDVPLAVIVNGASASASEIVTGCLQKNGRARVVGLRSFGKGSVQNLYSLYTPPYAEPFEDANGNGAFDRGESFTDVNGNGEFDAPALKITIAKYYIGTTAGQFEFSPHRDENIVKGQRVFLGGIEPDVPVDPTDIGGWRVEELTKLEEQGVVEAYFKEHFAIEADKQKLLKLAVADTQVPEDYPGFKEFRAKLDTKLSDQDIWRWMHLRLRTFASNEIGRLLVGDWVADTQLQAAIQDLARREGRGDDIRAVSEYKSTLEAEYPLPVTYGDDLKTARPVSSAK